MIRVYYSSEIHQLNGQLPQTDYDKFGSNRLGINKNCGYGFCEHPSDEKSYDLAKDFVRDLKFQSKEYKDYRDEYTNKFSMESLTGGSTAPQWKSTAGNTSPLNCQNALNDLTTIIAREILPQPIKNIRSQQLNIYDNKYARRYINSSSSSQSPAIYDDAEYAEHLATVHVAILKRAYHQQVGTTPSHALNLARACFGNNSSIGHTHTKHLYYCFERQNWVLETNYDLTFKVIDQSGNQQSFQQQLICKTEAVLRNLIPLIDTVTLSEFINNADELTNYISMYNDGFILKKIVFDGYAPYIELFHAYATWNSVQYPDFPKFITASLKLYIDSKKAKSKLKKLAHSTVGTIHGGIKNTAHKTTDVKLSAANKLYTLLTAEFADVTFESVEQSALKEGRLNALTQNLGFLIGIKLPDLYNALNLHLQNPLQPPPVSIT